MRKILLCTATLGCLAAVTSPAKAVEWPWCAILMDRDGSSTNCGFASREQCLTYLSGIGGYCQRNPRFRGRPPRY